MKAKRRREGDRKKKGMKREEPKGKDFYDF